MIPVKLLSLDLDGTLLRNDKTVSEYTRGVLRRCRERGIAVAVNTGRNERVCERVLPFIQPDVIISSGGAVARAGGELIYKAEIPAAAANEVIRRCLAHPDVSDMIVDVAGGYLAQKPLKPDNPLYIDYCNRITLTDFSREVEDEVYSVGMLCSSPKAMEEIINSLPGLFLFAAEPESAVWRAIQSTRNDKWLALKAVAARISINAEEIAAFGDDWNDMEQLRNAGWGVAMGNAPDWVKAVAREVCGTNENDGAARWIEENILEGHA